MKQPVHRRQLHPEEPEAERKQVEEALRESEGKLRLMIESVTDGITVADLNGGITEVNERTVEIHGFGSKNELLGKSAFELIAPRDHEKAMVNMQKTLSKGSIKGIEYVFLRADGSEFPAELSASVLRDTSGNPVGFIAITRDITERRRMEEALKQSEEIYRRLFEVSPIGITTVDMKGVITSCNPAVYKKGGYSEGELVGKHFSKIAPVRVSDIPKLLRIFSSIIRGRIPKPFEVAYNRKDGTIGWTEIHTALLESNGRKLGIQVLQRDITEHKRAEAQLLAYQKELRSLASQLSLAEERERHRIATEVHDRVSQTLALCRMKLGALAESASSSPFAESLGEIHTLIKQLIGESRSLTFELSSPLLYEVGLEAAVEHLTEQMQEQYGILFNFEDVRGVKPLDDDVRVLLFQTVRELLINITKHAQASHAKVCLKGHNSELRITVEDDGVGFDTSEISTDMRRTKGFGLFSIHERLRHIGGSIEVESEHDRGTRVTLTVPLKQA